MSCEHAPNLFSMRCQDHLNHLFGTNTKTNSSMWYHTQSLCLHTKFIHATISRVTQHIHLCHPSVATILLPPPWTSSHSSVDISLDIKPLFCCLPGYQTTLLLPPWISSHSSVASLDIKSTMELPPNTPQPEETAAQGDVFHSACHATAIPPPLLSQNPQSAADLPSNLHPIQTLPPFLSMPCASAMSLKFNPSQKHN